MWQAAVAVVFLGSLFVGLAAVAVLAIRRSPYTPKQSLLFFVDVLVVRLWWRGRVPMRLPIPADQGAVLVANHRSSIDPCFLQLPARRVIHWMVADDFFGHPVIGRLLAFVQAIATRRSGVDTSATKNAVRLASEGGIVGVFPEGRINRGEDFMMKVRPGAAMIAIRAGVPIVPCYLHNVHYDGTVLGPLLMPGKVELSVGDPIPVDEYAGRASDKAAQIELIGRAVRAIAKLAGHEDFQPEVAGRKWLQQQQEDAT